MIHHSCDRCKRVIDPDGDLRYVVRLEVTAAAGTVDGVITDEDRDHLLEIDEILERLEDSENPAVAPEVHQRRRFDLCSDCARKFLKNPLGRETPAKVGFGSN